MAKVVATQKIALDSEQIPELREIINEWSNRVPHHDHQNFGDQIEFRKVVYKPCYSVIMETQYDRRTIEIKKESYKGEALPARLYRYPSDVDLWELEGIANDEFRDDEDFAVIDGSQYVETCENCKGHGKIKCPTCDGRGRVTCSACGGKPKSRCSVCGGRRTIERSCNHCSGGQNWNAQQQRYIRCSYCGGTGKSRERCYACNGTGVQHCSTCRGTGKVDCPQCGGSKILTCPACDGTGKIKYFYEMQQVLETGKDATTLYNTDISGSYPEIKIDPQTKGGRHLLDERKDLFTAEDFDDFAFIRENIQKQLNAAQQKTDEQTRIQFQNTRIVQWDLYEIHYEYDGESHIMIVHAPDNRVFDKDGPIAEVMWDYLEKARKLELFNKYSRALKTVSHAAEMDLFGYFDDIYELQEELQQKVMGHYNIGKWPAILGMAGLYYFLRLKLFQAPFIFLPFFQGLFEKFEMLPKVHLHTISVFFVLLQLAYASEKSTTYLENQIGPYISSFLLRVLLGFGVALIVSIYTVLILTVLEYAGFILIPDFIAMYTIKLLTWLWQLIF